MKRGESWDVEMVHLVELISMGKSKPQIVASNTSDSWLALTDFAGIKVSRSDHSCVMGRVET